jgi:hypothetical protein
MHPYAFIPKDGSWFYIISEPYTGGDLTKLVASASEAQVKASILQPAFLVSSLGFK